MLTAQVQETDRARIVKLAGVLDDTVDFETLIGPMPRVILVECSQITRVNSIGVKRWMQYFALVPASQAQIVYVDCSPAIVEQFNMVVNFGGAGRIRSVQAPFTCMGCDHRFVEIYMTENLLKEKFNIGSRHCPKCKGEAVFDDHPAEYFSFLMR